MAAAFVSHPRRFLHAADEVPSEVVLTEKGINALWVGFAMNLLSTMYFIRASVHSHSKVRGREGGLSSSSALPDTAPHSPRPTDRSDPSPRATAPTSPFAQSSRIYHYITALITGVSSRASRARRRKWASFSSAHTTHTHHPVVSTALPSHSPAQICALAYLIMGVGEFAACGSVLEDAHTRPPSHRPFPLPPPTHHPTGHAADKPFGVSFDFIWVHYADWVIATPMLLVDLGSACRRRETHRSLPPSFPPSSSLSSTSPRPSFPNAVLAGMKVPEVFFLCFCDIMMIGSGYAAQIAGTPG